VMMQIQLPQAVKIMIPAIISQCVVALKDTSLGYYVVAPGLTTVGRGIWIEFGNQLQTAVVISAIYIVCNLILSALATWAQRKLVGERRQIVHVPDPGATAGGLPGGFP
jgi:glutamate transport system permease protein